MKVRIDTTQNIFIEGDNLEVLKVLQKTYHNKIKMIYIDPPYNTGKDFIYKDSTRDSIEEYLEFSDQITNDGFKYSTNTETSGRYHTNWLNMIYPRIKLAHSLLKDDSVIFISIDDNEVHNLRKVCDEIFGEDNFIANFVWRKKTGASDSQHISTITESILLYAKNAFCKNILNQNKDSFDVNRYKLTDEYVSERGSHYIDNLDRGGISYSDSLNYPITCPDGTITYPNGKREFINEGWTWTWGKDKLKWGIENGFIEFRKSKNKESGWAVCYKNYMFVNNKNEKIERSAPYKNLISDILNATSSTEIKTLFNSKIFSYTKPSKLIMQLITIGSKKDDIILDFFAGSGTTGDAVMQLNAQDGGNRKYILVQLPERIETDQEAYKQGYSKISAITVERLRRAGNKIIEDNTNEKEPKNLENLDVGFKYYKLASTNFKKWDNSPLDERYDMVSQLINRMENSIDNIKPDRTQDDFFTEILLKFGLPLNSQVEEITLSGKKVYSLHHKYLLICLEKEITREIAQEMINYHTQDDLINQKCRVVFIDNHFKSDQEKANIKQTLKDTGYMEVYSF